MWYVRASENYIWSHSSFRPNTHNDQERDIYKGWHKKDGILCLVKDIGQIGQAQAEQDFQVLRNLDHENIVKLWNLEKDQMSNVMVTEYCSDGTLLSILSNPGNSHGLSENDFLYLLHDLGCGLNHLWNNGIFPRKISPENIVQHQREDGRVVFKLAYFEIMKHGKHEEIYERTVLKSNPICEALCSVGATIGQAATGYSYEQILDIMAEMMSGAISSSSENSYHSMNAEILFDMCNLSRGLRELLMPLLTALHNSNQKLMSFGEFFDEVSAITSKVVLLVFSLSDASLLHIYCEPNACFSKFQELVEKQSKIAVDKQLLFYENEQIVQQMDKRLPVTSKYNPIFLFSKEQQLNNSAFEITLPGPSEMDDEHVDIEEAGKCAKEICNEIYYFRRIIADVHLRQTLMKKAATMFDLDLCQKILDFLDFLACFQQLVMLEDQRIVELNGYCEILQRIFQDKNQVLSKTVVKLEWHKPTVTKSQDKLVTLHSSATELYSKVTSGHNLMTELGCQDDGNSECLKHVDTIANSVNEISMHIKEILEFKNLSEEMKGMLKHRRDKMGSHFSDALSKVQDDCILNAENIHRKAFKWYCEYQNVFQKFTSLKGEADRVSETLNLMTDTVDQHQAAIDKELKRLCEAQGIPVVDMSRFLASSHHISRHKVVNGEFVFEVTKHVYGMLQQLGVVPVMSFAEASQVQRSSVSSNEQAEKKAVLFETTQIRSPGGMSFIEEKDEPKTLT